MNAPETLAPPDGALTVARAPLSHFAPSLTNRNHDQEYLTGLAATIKVHKVLQPITARPWPASRGTAPAGVHYEIVIGEGRWLASAIAKEPDIPFFWRELDDRTALEIQLIENLKRKDLSAIEEADGYRRLKDDHGHTADTIAEKIGKSRGYVYARLKLLDLCPAALASFKGGKFDASIALLIARIPDHGMQEKAAKDIANGLYGANEPMSYRKAADHVQQTYMLKLAEAPFSRADAELLPSAGRCQDCPKRTGNQKDLYADVKNADMCTDPACFNAKREAYVAQQRKLAKAEGRKVIEGADAKKIKPNSYDSDLNGGYVDLDKRIYQDNGKTTTVRQLLGKDAPAPDILIDPHQKGKVIEVVSKASVQEKLEAKGGQMPMTLQARGARSEQEKEAARKLKREATYRQRLFDQIRSKLTVDFSADDADTNLELREYRLVTERMYGLTGFDDKKRLARLWIGPTDEKQEDHALIHELGQRIPGMDRKDLCRLLIELALVGEVSVNSYGTDHKPEKMLATAIALKIDADEIKKGVIAETKPVPKAKAAKKPPTPAKLSAESASTPTQAAQAKNKSASKPAAPAKAKKAATTKPKTKADRAPATPAKEPAAPVKTPMFQPVSAWPFPIPGKPAGEKLPEPNENGVYPEEAAEVLTWSSGKKMTTLRLLKVHGGWIQTFSVTYKTGGMSSPLTTKERVLPTHTQALKTAAADAMDFCLGKDVDLGYTATEKTKLNEWLAGLIATEFSPEELEAIGQERLIP